MTQTMNKRSEESRLRNLAHLAVKRAEERARFQLESIAAVEKQFPRLAEFMHFVRDHSEWEAGYISSCFHAMALIFGRSRKEWNETTARWCTSADPMEWERWDWVHSPNIGTKGARRIMDAMRAYRAVVLSTV